MSRFSKEFIEKLKSETDLVRLIEGYGTKLTERKRGELTGLCPLHDDKESSLVVNREKNTWKCSSCVRGGDVIEWVQAAEKVGFRHAVELLAASRGGRRPPRPRPRRRSSEELARPKVAA